MAKKRRKFTEEQKVHAIRLVEECGNISQVARDLDLDWATVSRWVKQARIDRGEGPEGALTTDEKAELARLRREIRTLREERDFLKKAAAFFAKKDDPYSS